MSEEIMSRTEGNKLRGVIQRAQDTQVISADEAGFAVMLAEKFRADIERKTRILLSLQGEIAQLRANEKIIMELIQNLIAANERAKERDEAVARVKGGNRREGVLVVEDPVVADEAEKMALETD